MRYNNTLILFLVFSMMACGASAEVTLANALDGLSKTSFGRESKLVIGDTVDAQDPSRPKERCIAFDLDKITPDTTGAFDTTLDIKFIRDSDHFDNTFKFSYNVEASSSINFASVVEGNSSLKSFGKFESFLKESKESALIVIEAVALHGRDMITEFALKPEYEKLIKDGEFLEFRKRCGTHFVRGWNRHSRVQVIVEISNLDRQAKLLLENTISGSIGAKIKVSELGAGVKAKADSSLSNTLNLANKFGTVSARVETVGGEGIPSVAQVTQLVESGSIADPANISKILAGLITASQDFSYENSKPEAFVMVSHPRLDSANVDFQAIDFEKLGDIYQALLRVDERLSLYDSYKAKDFSLWEKYFRILTDQLAVLRRDLIQQYKLCKNQGNCSQVIPDIVDGLILSDVLYTGSMTGRCRHTYSHIDKIGESEVEKFAYLSSISVVWKGKISFFDSIDPLSTKIKMITPDFRVVDVDFDPQRHQRNIASKDGKSARAFWETYRYSVNPAEIKLDENDISIDALRNIRALVGQSIFVAVLNTPSGWHFEQVLGRPDLRGCPIYVQ